ncbi:MAG: hypothetical protein IPQ08_12980 [Chitinophagaceae bacterium]|nr:hypothetical protein [Chitinophagaceae bacterium]
MKEYPLFILYLVAFSWLVTRIRFFSSSDLSRPQLVILFLLKVMAGIFYGWIGVYYGGLAQMQDTWSFHAGSIQEYHLLFTHPGEYFTNLFHNPYDKGMEKFFGANDSYWNDLKGNVLIKLFSLFNIFSFGYYYVNVIFYSFISLFGAVAIYKVMDHAFPGRKLVILLSTFLLPSFLYWSSGLHKEGLIFTGISLVIYSIYFSQLDRRITWKRVLMLFIGLVILLAIRNFLLVIIIPALIAWTLAFFWPKKSLAIFAGVYLVFGIFFFTARYLVPSLDFPQAVVEKQQAFLKLQGGNSSLPITQLDPTAISFIRNSPEALNLSSIRPYPSDVKHILSLAAAIEIDGILILFLLFLLLHRGPWRSPNNLVYFCLFFSFSVLMAIGFSVNNLGAIVRYRSVVLPLLIIPMAASLDWKRLGRVFGDIKNNNNV